MQDPNKYRHGSGILIADGGEAEGGDGEGGDPDGEGDEPTLKEVKESIDNATDRMEDIHETVKSVESTQDDLTDRVSTLETDVETLKEGEEPGSSEGEGEGGEPEEPEGVTEEEVEEMVEEATEDLATPEDVEAAVEGGSEKALAKFVGLDPDELPEDDEEKEEVIRKAVHEAGSDTAGDADESTVAKSEVADRDEKTGEVVLSTDAVADLEA